MQLNVWIYLAISSNDMLYDNVVFTSKLSKVTVVFILEMEAYDPLQ